MLWNGHSIPCIVETLIYKSDRSDEKVSSTLAGRGNMDFFRLIFPPTAYQIKYMDWTPTLTMYQP